MTSVLDPLPRDVALLAEVEAKLGRRAARRLDTRRPPVDPSGAPFEQLVAEARGRLERLALAGRIVLHTRKLREIVRVRGLASSAPVSEPEPEPAQGLSGSSAVIHGP